MDQGITNYESLTKAIDLANTFICEASMRLTFKQFQASREAKTMSQGWCEDNDLDASSAEVLMYPEGSFIILSNNPGCYQLIIERSEWRSNNLESLERILYDHWYC